MRAQRVSKSRTVSARGSRPRLAAGTGPIQTIVRDSERRVEDFATIVHDLKNPLATIALEAYILDHALAAREHAELRRVVARITSNVAFVDRMVDNLLDSYSLDAGHFEIRRKPTELRSLLEGIVDRVATHDRGRVVVEATDRTTISIDELRIERVIANLIGNALKYAPRPSSVVVRLDVGSRAAQISVADAGPGMTAEETEYVFDRHRRASTARVHEGYGLGLYVSKVIVEAHGGRIGVDSIHGEGSRFFFELPTC